MTKPHYQKTGDSKYHPKPLKILNLYPSPYTHAVQVQKTMITMLPLAARLCHHNWFLAWLSDCQVAMVGGCSPNPHV